MAILSIYTLTWIEPFFTTDSVSSSTSIWSSSLESYCSFFLSGIFIVLCVDVHSTLWINCFFYKNLTYYRYDVKIMVWSSITIAYIYLCMFKYLLSHHKENNKRWMFFITAHLSLDTIGRVLHGDTQSI